MTNMNRSLGGGSMSSTHRTKPVTVEVVCWTAQVAENSPVLRFRVIEPENVPVTDGSTAVTEPLGSVTISLAGSDPAGIPPIITAGVWVTRSARKLKAYWTASLPPAR
jgi:hypothetical protein